MQKLEKDIYTKQEIMDMLHAKNKAREVKFKYMLLDKNENVKKELTTVLNSDISMSAFSDIKRTAKFTIQEDANIDWLSDRVQPFIMFKTPLKKTYIGKTVTETFETSEFIFNFSGDWVRNSTRFSGGIFSFSNKDIGDSQTSSATLQLEVTEYATCTFDYYISTEPNYDKLWFIVDNQTKFAESGLLGLKKYTCALTKGLHTLSWEYRKDNSGSKNDDTVYIDNLTITNVKSEVLTDSWVEYSQGIFLLSTPVKGEFNGKVIRNVEAYDGLLVLKQDKMDTRYSIASGTNYVTAIKSILTSSGITKVNLENTDKLLGIVKEWEIGTEKLKIINELLSEINYTQMWVDELGYYTANKYIEPSTRAVDYIYADDQLSIIYNGLQEELDTFNIPNKFVVVASNPEKESLVSTFINSDANNVLSTISRGRTITDFRKIDNIVDQTTLDEYTKRIANQSSQVFGYVDYETGIMPMHSYSDILQVIYSSLNINYKFLETNWSMKLEVGSKMKHRCRRMVTI